MFLSWYNRPDDPSNSLIERFGVLGAIDGGGAVTFQPNQLISSSNFPVVRGQDPVVNPTYMGDSDQAVATNANFCITWGDNRLANPNFPAHTHQPDVRFAQVPVCTAPVISSVSASPNSLWPPNHKFVDVTIDYTSTSIASAPALGASPVTSLQSMTRHLSGSSWTRITCNCAPSA